MSTHDVLANLRRLRERLAEAPHQAAIHIMSAIAWEPERAPALTSALGLRLGERAKWVTSDDDPPDDVQVWGADAAAAFVVAHRQARRGRPFIKCFFEGLPPRWNHLRGPGFWDDSGGVGRRLALAMFADPILHWAEVVLGALPGFSDFVSRWGVRVETFGISGLPSRDDVVAGKPVPDEAAFQQELARYLFDQGFDLGDLGREQQLRYRTGQGARVDFLLRDGHRVVVELVLVRAGSATVRVVEHATQFRDYCRLAPAKHGMLVVVNADPKRKLRILPEAATSPAGIDLGGVSLLVQVADVMRPNASEAGKRKVADVAIPGV